MRAGDLPLVGNDVAKRWRAGMLAAHMHRGEQIRNGSETDPVHQRLHRDRMLAITDLSVMVEMTFTAHNNEPMASRQAIVAAIQQQMPCLLPTSSVGAAVGAAWMGGGAHAAFAASLDAVVSRLPMRDRMSMMSVCKHFTHTVHRSLARICADEMLVQLWLLQHIAPEWCSFGEKLSVRPSAWPMVPGSIAHARDICDVASAPPVCSSAWAEGFFPSALM